MAVYKDLLQWLETDQYNTVRQARLIFNTLLKENLVKRLLFIREKYTFGT